MYFRRKTSAGRAYLQIVESRRDGDRVRQQVIATLGRFEELQASGQLERLLRSGARFAAKAMMLSTAADDAAIKIAIRRIGPALVFERLWEETGCRAVIADLAGKRGHKSSYAVDFVCRRGIFVEAGFFGVRLLHITLSPPGIVPISEATAAGRAAGVVLSRIALARPGLSWWNRPKSVGSFPSRTICDNVLYHILICERGEAEWTAIASLCSR
jgi:hypothetical protein